MHYIMNKEIVTICIESSEIINMQYCPRALCLSDLNYNKIYNWIKHRALPLSRKNAEKIYKAIGLSRDNSEMELMYLTHALSINDNYWIANESEIGKLKYSNISLYNNNINNSMYLIALKGVDGFTIQSKELSAEYTGQGNFPKCFIRENDGIYMYKAGSKRSITNEVYAGYIAEVLGLRTAHYEYVTLDGIECTKSRILTNEDATWESAFILSEFFSKNGESPQSYAEKAFASQYADMVIFDAIVLNDDRHMKNWSFEFNSENAMVGLAPSYDYNNCLIGDSRTLSNLIFNDRGKIINILSAGRIAYRRYGTTLRLNELIYVLNNISLDIDKKAIMNRIEYITGYGKNQSGCY